MKVTLIILTLNSARRIAALLAAVGRQTRGPDQVFVVDSSSDDGTAAIAAGLGARVIEVKRSDFDHGGTRTLAGRAADGGLLLYMTDDALPADERAFEELLGAFADAGVGAAYGRQLPRPGADTFSAHLRAFNYPAQSHVREYSQRRRYGIKTPFLSNSFCAYRKDALEKIGWFSPRLILGEDTCAGARLLQAGYKLAYRAGAAVWHSHSYTPLQEARRYFDIGVFHQRESWLLADFGAAEGEGGKYVLSGVRALLKAGAALSVPAFLARAGLKFVFYRLGRRHALLPAAIAGRLSMHRGWWRGAEG